MAKHRTHSVDFKRQMSQEHLGGETLHGLAKRHDLSRNLILTVIDCHTREALSLTPRANFRAFQVIEALDAVVRLRGRPKSLSGIMMFSDRAFGS